MAVQMSSLYACFIYTSHNNYRPVILKTNMYGVAREQCVDISPRDVIACHTHMCKHAGILQAAPD